MTPALFALVLIAGLGLAGCNAARPPVLQGWVEADLIFVVPTKPAASRPQRAPGRSGHLAGAALDARRRTPAGRPAGAGATLKNAQLAYDRAVTPCARMPAHKGRWTRPKRHSATAQARLNSSKDSA